MKGYLPGLVSSPPRAIILIIFRYNYEFRCVDSVRLIEDCKNDVDFVFFKLMNNYD